jgi:hypothetical protein
LKGSNKIEFTITKDILNPTFQIDLQQPMKVEKLIAIFQRLMVSKEMEISSL